MNKKPNRMAELRHELLTDLEQKVISFLQEQGVPTEAAEHTAINLVNHLADHWGGQLINIPKDHRYKIASRDLEIYNAFDGRNHAALAREFSLSVRAIYDIVKKVQKLITDETQGSLF